MNREEREEFRTYLRGLTDYQVYGVFKKEVQYSNHRDEVDEARTELYRRNLDIP